jgi:hypothetical protein
MLITNDIRDDGFGAQYQSIIWSIIFAEVKGHTFYYSDIKWMNSDIDDTKKFIEDAVTVMNIKKHYPDVYSVYKLPEHTVYALKAPLFYKEIEEDIELYHNSASFERIKSYFYQGKQSPFDKEHLHIAVHLRRPAKFDDQLEPCRTRDDEYYIQIMKAIVYNYRSSEKPLLFHIYSIGDESQFESFKQFPIQFHLHDSTFESFIGMAFADILVISPSSMSYTAALLSNGIIYYKHFWHPPRKHWIIT